MTATRLNPDCEMKHRGDISGGDFNSYLTTGIWRVTNNNQAIRNFPNTSCLWGTFVVFASDNYVQQIYIGNYNTVAGRMWLRTSTSSTTFTDWLKVV